MIVSTTNINSIKSNNLLYKVIDSIKLFGFEGFIWIAALLYLAFFINPYSSHFTICPLSNLGFEHCPGCGLGNSIALLFRGRLTQSFDAHFLGIPALLIIFHRIFSLVNFNHNKSKSQ